MSNSSSNFTTPPFFRFMEDPCVCMSAHQLTHHRGPAHIIPITHYQSTFLKELVKSRDCGAHLGHHQIERADLTEEAY